ncbi:MAG: ABC transporter substrate-binding protein [Chloroflexota bacterium]
MPTAAPTGAVTPAPSGAVTPGPTGAVTPAPTVAETPAPTDGQMADQTLRLYLSSEDPPTLDQNAAQDSVSIGVLSLVHRPLQYWNPDGSGLPVDAAGIFNETESTPTHLVFNMRPEAVYSDGSPILASDFVFGIKRLVTPSLGNPYAYIACPIAGVAAFLPDCGQVVDPPADEAAALATVGVAAPDEQTVTVDLASAATYFRSVMAMWVMGPVKADWTFDEAGGFLSSGPFELTTWNHNSLIELTPNPNWYGEQKATVTIEYSIGGDPDAALAAFEQGNFDAVGVPGPQIARVRADAALSPLIQTAEAQNITYYGFATCQEPADACPANEATADGKSPSSNINFRRALHSAVNKQQMIDVLRAGAGTPANSIVMPGIPGHDPDYNPYPFNIGSEYKVDATGAVTSEPEENSARWYMGQALQELGIADQNADGVVNYKDATGLGLMKLGYNSNAGHLPYVAFLVNGWRQVGISDAQWDLISIDFATFLTERHAGTYDVSRNGWGADFPHAHNQLSDLFRCSGGNNEEQYCNTEFDDLVDAAAADSNLDTQTQSYVDAQRILMDDSPVMPLFWPIAVRLVQPYVEGLIPTGLDHQNTGDVFYEYVTIGAH